MCIRNKFLCSLLLPLASFFFLRYSLPLNCAFNVFVSLSLSFVFQFFFFCSCRVFFFLVFLSRMISCVLVLSILLPSFGRFIGIEPTLLEHYLYKKKRIKTGNKCDSSDHRHLLISYSLFHSDGVFLSSSMLFFYFFYSVFSRSFHRAF